MVIKWKSYSVYNDFKYWPMESYFLKMSKNSNIFQYTKWKVPIRLKSHKIKPNNNILGIKNSQQSIEICDKFMNEIHERDRSNS